MEDECYRGHISNPGCCEWHCVLPSWAGFLWAVEGKTGTVIWKRRVSGYPTKYNAKPTLKCRTTPAIDSQSGILVIGTQDRGYDFKPMAYVFGVNMTNGAKLWDKRISDHPAALVTQSPTISKGAVYVGASSAEEALSYLPIYQCCTFRGSFSKLDIKTGKEFWRRYMVPEPPAGDNMTTWFSDNGV
eukprot:jgi/Chrzof1/10867/Cz05g15100.t1